MTLFVAVLGREGSVTTLETLNSGFNFFCREELNEVINAPKFCFDLSESLKTTTITNFSGPPPTGGTPMAAVSRILSSTALQMRSISRKQTLIPPRFIVSSARPCAR
nr:hypothetical protein Iba_chr03cCG4500 [Ipomoea batatas]GME00751.1 hypothetical protein Iba_scaffold55803CG0010 [Ipomoea batatas]GME01474.1 hypothetical protein Iba_contig1799CG0030 [Ipomoea batatas]